MADSDEHGEEGATKSSEYPQEVTYCPIDGLPPEYSLYGPKAKQCIPWLKENAPEVLEEFDQETLDKLSKATISDDTGAAVSAEVSGEGSAEGAAGGASEEATEAKKKSSKKSKSKKGADEEGPEILIKREQRKAKKYMTSVIGLDGFGIRLKDASKAFSKKFAASSSVNSLQTGEKCVDVQGDVAFDVPEFLVDTYEIPAEKIFMLEKNKKVQAPLY
eukprot:gb/GECG01002367.1/.p1 GENE.gb/GECG01002367.1/~~gb/GECG01002367.1/.p1  ORF type:complete len:218 (+),score=54.35 gb/GECG01002367.1/:1-654(+)